MRLDLLILARLADGNPSRRDLLRLRSIASPGDPEATFARVLDQRIAALAASHLISPRPARITEAGTAKVRADLGVKTLPPWKEVRDHLLPAMAGHDPSRKYGAQATMLAQALGRPRANLTSLGNAVIAEALGITGAITMSRLRAYFLAQKLGVDVRTENVNDVVKVFLQKTAGAAGIRSQRIAAIQRWLADEPTPVGGAKAIASATLDKPSSQLPLTPSRPTTDDDVVSAVHAATARVPSAGRFGDQKVFISAIWRALDDGAALPGLRLDDFKQKLVAANQRGALTLARADLLTVMDPREVAASETRDRHTTFHFVIDRSRA